MSRLSRGCLRCRQRRVKCDQGKPSCQRCINRNEVCEGYRDETSKVIENAASTAMMSPESASSRASRRRSRSVEGSSPRPTPAMDRTGALGSSEIQTAQPHASKRLPWIKQRPKEVQTTLGDDAVDSFMENYVMYPCSETSSPGFLEHLPCLFKEVNVEGRHALRWAVQAAGYADICGAQSDREIEKRAFECYGLSLNALGESLSAPGKVPDDYDLMTVVVLDIFETLFIDDPTTRGMHAQGMAHILRLRGHDQIYNTRGWSLFRLAHHRIQKQQLAYRLNPTEGPSDTLDRLNDDVACVRLEKDACKISQTCQRARDLQEALERNDVPAAEILEVVHELLNLDREVLSWRKTPRWSYKTVALSDLPSFDHPVRPPTQVVELHADIWMAYEWNYSRAARIIAHEHLLQCLTAALASADLDTAMVDTLCSLIRETTLTIQTLADEILATVPQSLGDIDRIGRIHDAEAGPARCRGIGGYLLLWPIKIIKGPESSTRSDQKLNGQMVFERIRKYTGMKSHLGTLSSI
ncbi:hypothetical protein F5Y15DRAFT_74117 [Xylariaceae sp. FL0016]|nr:hypothetical protein F5Y15DRAFT_74117 [Xylariaceae sp. FL0016]